MLDNFWLNVILFGMEYGPMNKSDNGAGVATVLVIDDEQGLLDMLAYSLSELGYTVETANSGEEGVEKAKKKPYGAIICDITMPGIGGILALEALKALQPTTEVIMVTGCATDDSAKACKELGAFGYIAKPYELDPLREILNRAIDNKRSHGGATAH